MAQPKLKANEAAQRLKAARAKAAQFPKRLPAGGAVVMCPLAKLAKSDGRAIVQARKPEPPSVVCRLIDATVVCGHGRHAQNGLLAVVPDSMLGGDAITGAVSVKGGCGRHAEWTIAGGVSQTHRGASVSFKAGRDWGTLGGALRNKWIGIGRTEPQIYRVNATACEGGAGMVEIRAYPPGTHSIGVDFQELRDALKDHFKLLPLSEQDKKGAEFERGWFLPSVEFEQEFKEEQGTPRVYCDNTVRIVAEPLLGFTWKFPLWSPIPPFIDRWARVGFYLGVDAGLNLKVWAAWQYWPDTCRIDGNHGEVALSGDITARLSFDIFLASEDLLKMELAGETGFELEGSWAFEQQPYGMLVGQWRGLDALVEIRVLWGIVEYKRTWEVWHPNVRFQYRLEPGAGGD